MELARFLDFKPKFDQRLQQLTGQPYVLAVAGSDSDSGEQRARAAGQGTTGVQGFKAGGWSVAVDENESDEEKPVLNLLNVHTTTTPQKSSRNGLLGSESIRHQRRSSSSAEIDEDDDAATLWSLMMKLRNFSEKDLFKGHEHQLSEVELKKVFQKKNAEATGFLKSTSKDVKDKWKMWYTRELDTAKFINKQRNQTAKSVDAMFKKRFGSLGGKFQQGWTESYRDSGDILRDFMPDDPLELTLIKGYGREWEAHYRKLKESKAEELYKSVVYLREYKLKMTTFMDSKLCIDGGDFEAAEVATLKDLEAPTGDIMEQLNGFVQEIRNVMMIKVESNRVAETTSVQKAIEYAFDKYKEILKEKMMEILAEQDESAGNSKCGTAKAKMAAFHEWDEMQKKVYNIVSGGFETAPGFEYTSLWKWPVEEPETLKRYNSEERDKFIMCRFNGLQEDKQQTNTATLVGMNRYSCQKKTESNRQRRHSSGSDSSEGIQLKRYRRDFSDPPGRDQLRHSISPVQAPHDFGNFFVGLHYGSGATIVQILSLDGIRKTIFKLENIVGVDRNESLKPVVSFKADGRRMLLKLIPSELIVNHDQISTAEWETSSKRFYFRLDDDTTEERLHAEEILALHLQHVLNRIEQFDFDPCKVEKVVVAVPAVSTPACRRRLKSALALVGWTNSVFVHTSTAIALSCTGYRHKSPSKNRIVTVHLRSGLVEVAVFEMSVSNKCVMRGVESSRKIGYLENQKEDSAVSETVALIEKLLADYQVPKSRVGICALVVETKYAQRWIQGLEKGLQKAGIHCTFVKRPASEGILQGLGLVAEANFSVNLYQETFPWNIFYRHGYGNEEHLVKSQSRTELVTHEIPVVDKRPLQIQVQSLDRHSTMQRYTCLRLKNSGLLEGGEKLAIQVTSQGLISAEVKTAGGEVIRNWFGGPFMTQNQLKIARERIKRIAGYRESRGVSPFPFTPESSPTMRSPTCQLGSLSSL